MRWKKHWNETALSPPAAGLPLSERICPWARRWVGCERCPRGSWWCILHCTRCCKSCYMPPEPPSQCACPPPPGSASVGHPDAKHSQKDIGINIRKQLNTWLKQCVSLNFYVTVVRTLTDLFHSSWTVDFKIKVLRDLKEVCHLFSISLVLKAKAKQIWSIFPVPFKVIRFSIFMPSQASIDVLVKYFFFFIYACIFTTSQNYEILLQFKIILKCWFKKYLFKNVENSVA